MTEKLTKNPDILLIQMNIVLCTSSVAAILSKFIVFRRYFCSISLVFHVSSDGCATQRHFRWEIEGFFQIILMSWMAVDLKDTFTSVVTFFFLLVSGCSSSCSWSWSSRLFSNFISIFRWLCVFLFKRIWKLKLTTVSEFKAFRICIQLFTYLKL